MNIDSLRTRYPSVPYVLPFVVFLAFLALERYIPLTVEIEFPLRLAILGAVLWFFSRDVIDFRARQLLLSTCLGIAVFIIWILPDFLFPHYRTHWLFQNFLTGPVRGVLADDAHQNAWILACRSIRAVFFVPVIEELFWRAWLMRWFISPRFQEVRLGAYNTQSFLLVAVLFASEHGPFWDVGLVAGLLYNWWLVRTRSLGDCILAHAVTNACLCGFVIATKSWQYWL